MFVMSPSTVHAWLLLCLSTEQRGLSEIIAAADGINKAIPTLDEICDGFGWLKHHGLIGGSNGQFVRLKPGQSMVDDCGQGERTISGHWDRLSEALGELPDGDFSHIKITEEELAAAYADYRRRFGEEE